MLAKVTSFALIGLESTLVDVEVDISRGLQQAWRSRVIAPAA